METVNKDKMQRGPVTLYLEANPNPNSMKFVANYMLVPEGESFDFPDEASAVHAPIAKELFTLDYVKRVFYMSNFITVTKDEKKEWIEVRDEVKALIKNLLDQNTPLLVQDPAKKEAIPNAGDETDIEKNIKNILDEYVRPAVEQDGGAISFHSYHDGVVKVLLQGSCSGCPSSTVTLKAGIENLLKRMIPEIKSVEAEGV